MNSFFKSQIGSVAVVLTVLPAVALSQVGIPPIENCVGLKGVTNAPGGGTITVTDLAKYGNYPAQACTKSTFTGSNVSFEYTVTEATAYANAKFPSSCAGIEYTLDGGPEYSAVTGTGNFSIDGPVTGTLVATAFFDADNLRLTAAGNSFLIDTDLLSFKSIVTFNADESVDIRICTPPGGIPARVNGSNFLIPRNIWQCLSEPVENDPKVRITYDENCPA